MVRILVIAFSVFYLTAVAGLPLTVHYCHGSIASVQVFAEGVDCCCGHDMAADRCCLNVRYWLKAETDSQLASQLMFLSVYETALVMDWQKSFQDLPIHDIALIYPHYDLPPPEPVPIWLMDCSLTYYG